MAGVIRTLVLALAVAVAGDGALCRTQEYVSKANELAAEEAAAE